MPKRVEVRNSYDVFGMNDIEEEDEEQDEMIFGVEDLCGVSTGGAGIFGVRDRCKVVEVTVDSGASKSVWPRAMKGVKRNKVERTPRLVAANGTEMQVDGETVLGFKRRGKEVRDEVLERGCEEATGGRERDR